HARSLSDGYFTPPHGFLEWVHGRGPSVTSIVFRREILEAIGTLDPTIFHSDIDYVWRVATRFPFVASARLALVVAVHREQGTRRTALETPLQSYLAIRERVRRTPDIPAALEAETEHYLRRLFSQTIFHAGLRAIIDGEYAQARHAATMLRATFDRKRAATTLNLLANGCERVAPLHWVARAFLLAGKQVTEIYTTARRDRAYAALRAEISAQMMPIATLPNESRILPVSPRI
ncbi:MAG: hypothetical protein ACYDAR_18635, partial [Thermomicrobiales bacterium]